MAATSGSASPPSAEPAPPATPVTADLLRRSELLAECGERELGDVLAQSAERRLANGELLFSDADRASGVWILLDGELVVTKVAEGDEVVLDRLRPGAYLGEISLLTGLEARHRARAAGAARVLHIPGETFRALLQSCRPVMETVLRTMAERLKRLEVLAQEHARMAALGKMAAGLAHELKNPASAAKRAAEVLREKLGEVAPLAHRLAARPWTPAELALLRQLESATSALDPSARELDALERSDREEALRAWLEAREVERAWALAPTLVDRGVTTEQLDAITRGCDLGHVVDSLDWVERIAAARQLLDEVAQSTTRIGEIVKAVKNFSFVDANARRDVDVHESLELAITLLGHELRAAKATVARAYDRSLPLVASWGSELNHVWQNLLDNAADAVAGVGGGTIRVATAREGGDAVVRITDGGPGIPEAVQARIFEPFFTTKGAGKGTGLGLEIVQRIVRRHHGTIVVDSRPGETTFTVRLPLTAAD